METRDTQTRLWSLIRDIHIPMISSFDSAGNLRSRPLATQQSNYDGNLWFFVSLSACKELDAAGSRKVNLSYADPFQNTYVSVSGTAELEQDKAKYKELWNPIYHGWFPLGFDDPDLKLIRVHVEKAECWDPAKATMIPLSETAEPTGQPAPEAMLNNHSLTARGMG